MHATLFCGQAQFIWAKVNQEQTLKGLYQKTIIFYNITNGYISCDRRHRPYNINFIKLEQMEAIR